MDEFTKQIFILIGAGIGGAFSIAFVFLYKQIFNWVCDRLERNISKNNEHELKPKDMAVSSEIREELVELRARVHSDRACLFQFHNGNVFTTKEPMWKVSCTVESAAPGIAYISDIIKDIKVSSIIETIHVLWPDSKLGSGIEVISPEYCKDCQIECKTNGRRIIFIDVAKLEDGYSRSLLVKQGVKFVIDVPIFDGHGNIMGFITTNYNRDMNIEEIKQTAYTVCQKTLDIEFMLLENTSEENK